MMAVPKPAREQGLGAVVALPDGRASDTDSQLML